MLLPQAIKPPPTGHTASVGLQGGGRAVDLQPTGQHARSQEQEFAAWLTGERSMPLNDAPGLSRETAKEEES
jgi:hypothetical protein